MVIVWHDTRRAPPPDTSIPYRPPIKYYDLFSQRLNGSGTMLWDALGVPVCADSGGREGGAAVTDGAGGAIVGFADNFRVGAYAQHLDGTGARRWAPDGNPTQGGWMLADGAGGAFIAWNDTRNGSDNDDVWLQRVDSQGDLMFPAGGVPVCTAPFNQRLETSGLPIASDGAGGVFLTWHDLRNGQDWDVFAQHMLASGEAAPGWPVNGIPVCVEPGFQIYPAILTDGAGGAIATWYDHRNAATGYDIYAQRITSAGAIAPGWPANGVALCTALGDQSDPVPVTDGAGGMIAYWNDYRGLDVDIYAQHADANGLVGAVTAVPPPILPALRLEPPRPDPASRELVVSFSVPTAERTEIAMFDVSGRRVLLRDLGALEPGRHSVPLGEVASLPAGLYLVQLTHGSRSLTERVSVVH
jgi:hypothetical protein